jgi:protein-S-isoprenylcysteine O-methyltransferase Ste14
LAFAPSVVLCWLAIAQASDAWRDWALFRADPNWTMASELARSALYAAFVLGAAITLTTSKGPRARDARGLVAAASLTASFLMIGASFLPAGPVLWNASNPVIEVGLLLTVIGAVLALTSFASLGSNFAIVPEARTLVVTGPYRWLRHPIYLAELLMIFGVVVGYVRLTTLAGVLSVVGLQLYRIRAEERLLRSAFPATFEDFTARTRYRLLPLLW